MTNDVDKEGLTALEVAKGYDKEAVCEVLEQHTTGVENCKAISMEVANQLYCTIALRRKKVGRVPATMATVTAPDQNSKPVSAAEPQLLSIISIIIL